MHYCGTTIIALEEPLLVIQSLNIVVNIVIITRFVSEKFYITASLANVMKRIGSTFWRKLECWQTIEENSKMQNFNS